MTRTSTRARGLAGLLATLLATAVVGWLVTLCRFDEEGFTFFILGCGVAISAFWWKPPWWSRPLPLLVMVGALAVCEQHAVDVMREGRALGDTIVAQCRIDGSCPVTPAGFSDGRTAIIDDRGSATYVLDGDGRGFVLLVRNALGTSRFHGGVTTELTRAETSHPD